MRGLYFNYWTKQNGKHNIYHFKREKTRNFFMWKSFLPEIIYILLEDKLRSLFLYKIASCYTLNCACIRKNILIHDNKIAVSSLIVHKNILMFYDNLNRKLTVRIRSVDVPLLCFLYTLALDYPMCWSKNSER